MPEGQKIGCGFGGTATRRVRCNCLLGLSFDLAVQLPVLDF